jgi:hypothetical protein
MGSLAKSCDTEIFLLQVTFSSTSQELVKYIRCSIRGPQGSQKASVVYSTVSSGHEEIIINTTKIKFPLFQ